MDQKTWLWKKKSSEKGIVAADKVSLCQQGHEEETVLSDKVELEREMKILNEKLSSALSECNAKDDLMKRNAKMAREALAGWERVESEAMSLKQQLDEVLLQKVAGEERITNLDMALKECMQQLRFVREELEQRIHDAVSMASREFEKARIVLEGNLTNTNARLAKLGMENTQITKALLAKEKVIEDINAQRTRVEADFNALMTRLESTEKENASMMYEVRVLEKELEIRNEEREFNRRTADAAHKQHLENVKKIAKFESECQRLRVLVRKRLPGPATLAKMKSEVEMLGRDRAEPRRRKSNLSSTGSMDFVTDNDPDTPSKKINFLAEQLCVVEEENRTLKEVLDKQSNELQFSRIMYNHAASKLSQVETQLDKSSLGQLTSMSEVGSDDKVNSPGSRASVLASESEHYRNDKQLGTPSWKTVGASDMDLMDDFVEMEMLATASRKKQFVGSHLSSVEGRDAFGSLEIQSNSLLIGRFPRWLQDILKAVLEQNRVTQRKPDEILEDIKVALLYIYSAKSYELVDVKENSSQSNIDASDYISWKPPNKSFGVDLPIKIICDENPLLKKSNYQLQSNLSKSIHKVIELIEGISLPFKDRNGFACKNSETPGYMVRVFQWKTSELSVILQKFIETCNDLLTGKAGMEKFAEDLTSALDWVINHCFSLQDVSSMRDAIKKQFDWDETRSESEVEVGTISQFSEADKLHIPREQFSYSPISALTQQKREETHNNSKEDGQKLKDKLADTESANKDLEGRLQSERDKSESLTIRLQESEKAIQNQIVTCTMVDETELEDKVNSCKELKTTCVDLQLQLESVTNEEKQKESTDPDGKQLQSEWEITAASEKLAECQETILNLGRQLKALGSPRDSSLFDKLVTNPVDNGSMPTTAQKSVNQHCSLLDKMLAEDNAENVDLGFPKTKEVICILDPKKPPINDGTVKSPHDRFLHINRIKENEDEVSGSFLAIVPSKKKSGWGLLKKLLWRKKRSNSKKTNPSFC